MDKLTNNMLIKIVIRAMIKMSRLNENTEHKNSG